MRPATREDRHDRALRPVTYPKLDISNMAALVQGYPQQSGSVTILQTRPNTTSGVMAGTSQTQSSQHYGAHAQRNNFHSIPGNAGSQAAYRGNTTAPVQPYAFTSTPNLSSNGQRQQYGGYRGSTAPSSQVAVNVGDTNTSRPAAVRQQAPQSSGPTPAGQLTFAQVASAKASPERYRRPAQKHADSSPVVQQFSQVSGSTMPSGSGTAASAHVYNPVAAVDRKAAIPRNSAHFASSRPQSAYASVMGTSVDDIHVPRLRSDDDVKKYRRRSLHSIDISDYANKATLQDFRRAGESFRPDVPAGSRKSSTLEKEQKAVARVVPLPAVEKNIVHARTGSAESAVSSRSSNSRPSSVSPCNTGYSYCIRRYYGPIRSRSTPWLA